MRPLEEFLSLAGRLAPEQPYRTVYDTDLSVLVPGKESIDADMLGAFAQVDFTGRTVVDIGCNFGFFTFQACRWGAARVLGVDREPRVLRGCSLLKEYFKLPNASFARYDIDDPHCLLLSQRFDIALLVEFVGKHCVVSNRVRSALAFSERLAAQELIVSIRKVYWIHKELGTTRRALSKFYPARYLDGGDFRLLDYVRDFLSPRWRMEALSPLGQGYEKSRKFLRFIRKR